MNKNDLVQKLSERTALSKMDAQKAVDGVFDVITDSLKAGEEITIKPSKAARFRAGKPLKDALNT